MMIDCDGKVACEVEKMRRAVGTTVDARRFFMQIPNKPN